MTAAVNATTAATLSGELPRSLRAADDFRVLDPLWDYLYENHLGLISSPVFQMSVAVGSYLFYALCFSLLDIALANGYLPKLADVLRIQRHKPLPTMGDFWVCLKQWIVNQFIIVLPSAVLQVVVFNVREYIPVRAPLMTEVLGHLVVQIFIHDILFYTVHRSMHIPWLYRNVHYVHHSYHTPFALVTQHLHWFETFCLGIVSTVPGKLLGLHPFTGWMWFVIVLFYSVEGHAGYQTSFYHITNGIMFGSACHDIHHRIGFKECNYGGWFTYMDRILGTWYPPEKADAILYAPAEEGKKYL